MSPREAGRGGHWSLLSAVCAEATIIFGAAYSPDMDGALRVSVRTSALQSDMNTLEWCHKHARRCYKYRPLRACK